MSWDALQNLWNRWLVSYDHETQQSLIRRLGQDPGNWRGNAWLLGAGSLAALGLGLIAALWRGRERGLEPAVRAWRRFQRKLRRAGLPVSATEPPMALARRATRRWPAQSVGIGRIAGCYIALRYRPWAPPNALIELNRAVRVLSLSRIR